MGSSCADRTRGLISFAAPSLPEAAAIVEQGLIEGSVVVRFSGQIVARGRAAAMIRVLLAEDQALVRGAPAALLRLKGDFQVVAQVGRGEDGLPAALEYRPAVATLNHTLALDFDPSRRLTRANWRRRPAAFPQAAR